MNSVSVIKFDGFNQKSSRRKKFVKRQMRRKPRNGEGDQIERITPRESRSSSGGGCSRGEARRTREVLGEEGEKGVLCAPLAREGLYDGGTSLS